MIEVKDYKELNGKEFFTVVLDGTEIKDCKIATSAKGEFVSGPSRSYTDREGKTKWVNQVTFSHGHQSEIMGILRNARVPEIDVTKEGMEDEIPFS